nr:MAG TPA: hypothetical protein [Caudoviricetes sp.]
MKLLKSHLYLIAYQQIHLKLSFAPPVFYFFEIP